MESVVTTQTAVTECRKLHQLLHEITLTKYRNHPLLIKCVVTTQGKLHRLVFKKELWHNVEIYIQCLPNQQWRDMLIHSPNNGDIIWKSTQCLLNVQRQHMVNAYPLFSETALTSFMEIHPLLIKCAAIKHWKQHSLLFEREQ